MQLLTGLPEMLVRIRGDCDHLLQLYKTMLHERPAISGLWAAMAYKALADDLLASALCAPAPYATAHRAERISRN
jgi:hypothetical protein